MKYYIVTLLFASTILYASSQNCGTTGHAECIEDGELISCFIVDTNETEIEQTISVCSKMKNYTKLEINLQLSDINFMLKMDLPDSITIIEIVGITDTSSLQLTADRPHISVITLKVKRAIILLTDETRNMFDIFPNIESIVCQGCTFSMLPSLIALNNLSSIEYSGKAQCDQGNLIEMDDLFVRGLSKITLIKWSGACIGNLSGSAFRGLINLEKLDLSRNEITVFPDDLFLTLFSLVTVDMFDNRISQIPSNAFEQLHSIDTISLTDNPLECSCDNSWLYLVERELGFKISGPDCPNGNSFTDPSNYENCTETFPHCFNQSALCDYKCVNEIDRFVCVCKPGYQIENVTTCVDVNECLGDSNTCEQTCNNTIGSYLCGCYEGYNELTNTTCQDVDECAGTTHGCEHTCNNTLGSYECSCNTGYMLMDGRTCQDVDECAGTTHGCEHTCNNTIGSYECSCDTGYNLMDGGTCPDTDECLLNIGRCDQICENVPGSYQCNCMDGYLVDDSDSFICIQQLTLAAPQSEFPPIFIALAVVLVILFILGIVFIISVIVLTFVSESRKKNKNTNPEVGKSPEPVPERVDSPGVPAPPQREETTV